MFRVLILLGALLLTCFGQQQSQDPLAPTTWVDHLNNELLPFWSHPDALGRDGDFPAIRCDDGTAVNWQRPCREIATNAWLMQRPRNVVAQSRQVYAYGVAFHMTGDRKYLDWMKLGLDYLRRDVVDRKNGGIATNQDARTGVWGPKPEWRNPQELAYGLVGFSFYYYLTRDPAVLDDIVAIKRYIFDKYFDNDAQVMKWLQADNGAEKAADRRLVATLDQMNAYLVLLTPILPEPYQSEWKADLTRLSIVLIEKFYNWDENLFYLTSNTAADRDPAKSATDFGHTIKAMWMIRWTGIVTENPEFVWFAETYGRQVLARAYQPGNGSWASGVAAGGKVDINKSWWIVAELDQFAATLSLQDPELASLYLKQTYVYWREYLVDKQYAEVWTTVDGVTNKPLANDQPKQWPWKNGYHSLEHALVAYITTSANAAQPVRLYFAHEPVDVRPYFFQAAKQTVERIDDVVVAVTFEGIR
jgi:mannose/cellobiose epimerase-like protein (N-acyl-D-glucosamine 2-epimerase family)